MISRHTLLPACEARVFAGSSFDSATPFALPAGLALVSGYALPGAGWLVLGTIVLFAVSCLGIAIPFWRMIVPGHHTSWQAASSEATRALLLVGTQVARPVVLP